MPELVIVRVWSPRVGDRTNFHPKQSSDVGHASVQFGVSDWSDSMSCFVRQTIRERVPELMVPLFLLDVEQMRTKRSEMSGAFCLEDASSNDEAHTRPKDTDQVYVAPSHSYGTAPSQTAATADNNRRAACNIRFVGGAKNGSGCLVDARRLGMAEYSILSNHHVFFAPHSTEHTGQSFAKDMVGAEREAVFDDDGADKRGPVTVRLDSSASFLAF